MAINVTSTTVDASGGVFGDATIIAAHDQYFEMALRHRPLWRNLVDKRPVDVTNPGDTVTLYIHDDLPVATTTLDELTDPTPQSLPAPSTVDISVVEKGGVVVSTRLLREFTLTDVDPYKLEQVAYQMENSLDELVRSTIIGGTNVTFGGAATSTATVDATMTLTSDMVIDTVTDLRVRAVMPKRGEYYAAYVHPHVSSDLRRETGDNVWRKPHEYVSPDLIWRGEIGAYEGAFFVETARVFADNDGAGVTPDEAWVYRNMFCGKQGIAEATAVEPGLVINGPVGQDYLNRKYSLGWYGVLGWSIFRQEALQRVETGSARDGAGLT